MVNTQTRPPEMISDWSPRTNIEVCLQFCCFLSEEFTSHLQHRHADNAPTIAMSRPNVREKPYFSVRSDFSSVDPFRCEQVSSGNQTQFLSVDFSHAKIYNSGLCASHLVNLLSQWLLRHGTLIVHLKLTGYNFSKSLLICCVIKNCH